MLRFSCLSPALFCLMGVGVSVAQVPAELGDWPQWRGIQRDGISTETGLLTEWPENGPAVLWSSDAVGIGYSSPVIKGGRLYTQGDLDGIEHILCLNAETGELIWSVQPEPVIKKLEDRVDREFAQADRNGNGIIDETEAWSRFGRNFNQFDQAQEEGGEGLTQARVSRLFEALDANGDGKLTFEEAGKVLRDEFDRFDAEDREADVSELAQRRARAFMTTLDLDSDGKISREEARESLIDRPFNQIDEKEAGSQKGDELLSIEELQNFLEKRQPGRDGELSKGEVHARMLREFGGRDGRLTREELKGFYGGYRNGQGDGPRGTPTVDGERVYVEGGNGDVTCLAADSGKTLWHVNLVEDFGGSRPGWGYSESPLIEGELVIVTPGGKDGTLVALNKLTGDVVWRSTEITEAAHYSSAVAADIGGIREIVQFARESVFGVDAKSGKLLWKYSSANNGTANCFTPIIDDDLVFVSSAYGTGTGTARIVTQDGQQSAEEVYFLKKLQSHHGGAVKIGDFVYSNGGGSLICLNYQTGEVAWEDRCVGKGSLIFADGMLYVFSERHEIALVEANPNEYREHGRFKIESHGRPSWAHPIVAGGKLYLRDQESIVAYQLKP